MDDDLDEISDWFWQIIHRADGDREKLRAILGGLPEDEIYRFADEFITAAVELTDEPYIQYVNPDESEDGVTDISHWVVSQGKDYYDQVVHHPERMPKHVAMSDPRNLFGVADTVYKEKSGRTLDLM